MDDEDDEDDEGERLLIRWLSMFMSDELVPFELVLDWLLPVSPPLEPFDPFVCRLSIKTTTH